MSNAFSPNYKSDYTPAKTSRGFVKKGEKLYHRPSTRKPCCKQTPP